MHSSYVEDIRPPAPDRRTPVKREESTPGLLEPEHQMGSLPSGLKAEPMDLDMYAQSGESDYEDNDLRPGFSPPRDLTPPPRVTPAPVSTPEPKIQLSGEQRAVLERVKRGENVFFTGSAGTGKSVLLREIIRTCREDGRQGRLAVTASTGIAAVNIGGTTLHSWAGIGLGKETADKLVGKLLGQDKWRRRKEAEQRRALGLPPQEGADYDEDEGRGKERRTIDRWKNVRTLIIDESMLHCICPYLH